MCLFIINKEKKKENQNQKKRNIKSEKIDKRKRKMLVPKCTITNTSGIPQEHRPFQLVSSCLMD